MDSEEVQENLKFGDYVLVNGNRNGSEAWKKFSCVNEKETLKPEGAAKFNTLRIIMAKEFQAPGKDVVQKIWQEFGLNEQRVKESVEALKKWLAMEPHLPEESGSLHEARLERWLIRCKNSMERTKQSIDLYYTLRSLSPDMMCDWNPRSKWYQDAVKTLCCFPMPELTPEGDRVVMIKYLTKDANNYQYEDVIRLGLMTTEVRMSEDYCFTDIFILDMENYTLAHACNVKFTSAKKCEVCLMKAFSCRLKALHIINAPSCAEVFIAIMKAVFSSKLTSRIYVHGKDLTNFRKQVPRMCLPDDLGGTGGSLQENWNLWLKKVDSYHDWFLHHENFKSDESKRQGGDFDSGDLFGFEGSFRSLNVD
ncbi:alpha-tocopherol transfer protein-like isoform X2 [Periplaneta americana]|uniref:alpha-tocopherol transfer protein-like isoform X2 n=1 Tax=Periplaneta americana TaxID=6978 RepID=UPI0037E97FE0